MTVHMAVTADKFELPVAVADTAEELAQMLGVKAQSVRCSTSATETKVFLDDVDEIEVDGVKKKGD